MSSKQIVEQEIETRSFAIPHRNTNPPTRRHARLFHHQHLGRRIESQSPAQLSTSNSWFGFPTPDSRLTEYEITAAFNDLCYYDDESHSVIEEQANAGILTNLIIIISGVFQQLSELAGYLFGLLIS